MERILFLYGIDGLIPNLFVHSLISACPMWQSLKEMGVSLLQRTRISVLLKEIQADLSFLKLCDCASLKYV